MCSLFFDGSDNNQSEIFNLDDIAKEIKGSAKKDGGKNDPRKEAWESVLEEANRYPMLTEEQERALYARIAKGGDDAKEGREALVNHNLRFAISEAYKYRKNGASDDCLGGLVEASMAGLFRAAENFDPAKAKGRFVSYARYQCDKHCTEYLNEMGGMHGAVKCVHLPKEKHDLYAMMKKIEERLMQELQRTPADCEIAEEMGISTLELLFIRNGSGCGARFDAPNNEEDEGWVDNILAEFHPDEQIAPIWDLIDCDIYIDRIRKVLDERSFFVVDKLHNGYKYRELAQDLGLKDQRVGQIYKAACEKLSHDKVLYLMLKGEI